MTKKDYIRVASAIRVIKDEYDGNAEVCKALYEVVVLLSSCFASENVRFNVNTFIATAWGTEGL